MLQTSDGSLVVLANIMYYPANDNDIQLSKFDGERNLIWSHAWETGNISGQSVIATSDGNYLISASYLNPDTVMEDFLFFKVDPEGNELWQSTFGDPDMIDYGSQVAETADGGFVATGMREGDLYTWEGELLLVKLDVNVQLLWEQSKPVFHTMFTRLFERPDEGYVIVGTTYRDPVFNVFLTQTDAAGRLE